MCLIAAPAHAATPVTYQGFVYNSKATTASADKPQSKLWYNPTVGKWHALMVNPSGTVNIFELQPDHTWRDSGTVVDKRPKSTGDALYSSGKLYVVSRTAGSNGAVKVIRFTEAAGTYRRDSGFPVTMPGGGTESATIDKDDSGTLWLTFTRGSEVWVTRSAGATHKTWVAPSHISGSDFSVSSDDISAVIAFEGKIGVMWSDQASNATRFAYHADGTPDSEWVVETPLEGTGLADDHMNLKSLQGDDEGRLYAAVKTSMTNNTDPILMVLVRRDDGTWTQTTTATVADKLTRPQLVLDKTNPDAIHHAVHRGRRSDLLQELAARRHVVLLWWQRGSFDHLARVEAQRRQHPQGPNYGHNGAGRDRQ